MPQHLKLIYGKAVPKRLEIGNLKIIYGRSTSRRLQFTVNPARGN